MFKITFNKPAVKMFFTGEDAAGIQIRRESDDKIMFRPVGTIGPTDRDVVPVSAKQRGGAEAVIDGSQSGALLKLLTNPLGNPYFILKRRAGGWMEAVPHSGSKFTPERFEPHIRIWRGDNASIDENTTGDDLDLRAGGEAPIPNELPASEKAREALMQLAAICKNLPDHTVPAQAYPQVAEVQEWCRVYTAAIQDSAVIREKKPRKLRESHARAKTGTTPAFLKSTTAKTTRRDRAFATAR